MASVDKYSTSEISACYSIANSSFNLTLIRAAIKYAFAQVDESLPKSNALKQYYVRKQELTCLLSRVNCDVAMMRRICLGGDAFWFLVCVSTGRQQALLTRDTVAFLGRETRDTRRRRLSACVHVRGPHFQHELLTILSRSAMTNNSAK